MAMATPCRWPPRIRTPCFPRPRACVDSDILQAPSLSRKGRGPPTCPAGSGLSLTSCSHSAVPGGGGGCSQTCSSVWSWSWSRGGRVICLRRVVMEQNPNHAHLSPKLIQVFQAGPPGQWGEQGGDMKGRGRGGGGFLVTTLPPEPACSSLRGRWPLPSPWCDSHLVHWNWTGRASEAAARRPPQVPAASSPAFGETPSAPPPEATQGRGLLIQNLQQPEPRSQAAHPPRCLHAWSWARARRLPGASAGRCVV